jgi:hypothetical protein
MAYIVAALTKGAHQARGLIRALADAGFPREEIDMNSGPIAGLIAMGIPDNEAHVFAEGARRGGAIVVVKADDEFEAEQAALLMHQHGAVDVEACDAGWRRLGWSGRVAHPAAMVSVGHYALVFGDYPGGSGRIYPDPRAVVSPSARMSSAPPAGPYDGPERRHMDKPYTGINRRAA